ncbi:hypothetical protein RB653_009504 [Dictyostelium firmibasis]|uniref:EGF-like domain-containing protein n=1 Tax=Dictyostelium firmibasis TaxID=79012 RepID=A0AAN7YXE9_9MYCE
MKILFILLFFLLFGYSHSKLIPSETNCLYNLILSSGNKNNYKLRNDSNWGYYCEDYPDNFKCEDSTNLLTSVILKSDSSVLYSSSLNCFQKDNLYLNLNLFTFEVNFFFQGNNFKNFSFELTNCVIYSLSKPIKNVNSLIINTNYIFSIVANTTIPISSIIELTSLTIINSASQDLNILYSNDLDSNSGKSRIKSLQTESKNVPNLLYANSIENVNFSLASTVKNDLSNLTTYTNVKTLQLNGNSYSYTFPIDSIKGLTRLNTLILNNIFFTSPTDQSIDFSTMTGLNKIDIKNPGSFSTDSIKALPVTSLKSFSINQCTIKSGYPIPGLFNRPGSVIESITITNCGMPDHLDILLPLANSLRYLDVTNNPLKGTISSQFCKLQTLKLPSNLLIMGYLPSCFACHYKNNSILKANLNPAPTLITTQNCTNLVPNLKIDTLSNRTILYGSDLGFDSSYFVTIPSTNDWIVDIPSYQFYRNATDITTFTFTFIYPGISFTLSSGGPAVTSVYVSNIGLLTIIGRGFSYNISATVFTILNDQYCSIRSTTFDTIVCQLYVYNNITKNKIDATSILKISGQPDYSFNVTYLPDFTNYYLNCSEDCTGKGFCDRNSGQCICNCHDKGSCDIRNRVCKCETFWLGDECTIPDHYVSSVNAPNILGGNVTLIGWYGYDHVNPSVFIGTLECKPIYEISTSTIICYVGAGSGVKSVTVIQNGHSWTGQNIFLYNNTIMNCPNDCTNSTMGICDQRIGQCNCLKPNFVGPDCSIEVVQQPPKSNTTVDTNSGSTDLNNDKTKYTIKITKLLELNFNNKPINSIDLLENNWNFKKINASTETNNFYIFNKIIPSKCNITFTIEEIEKDKEFTFADITFKVLSGSIKLTIEISNYTYDSGLNTLQLQMESSVGTTKTDDTSSGEQCDIANIDNIDEKSSLNYVTITKEGKTLFGRFINRALSDQRPTYISSDIVNKNDSSITIGLNLPHCINCIIDPEYLDFSILVQNKDYISDCKSGDNNNNERVWFLPVVIVVPVVSATTIVILSLVFYTKYRRTLKLKLQSLMDPRTIKMNDLN